MFVGCAVLLRRFSFLLLVHQMMVLMEFQELNSIKHPDSNAASRYRQKTLTNNTEPIPFEHTIFFHGFGFSVIACLSRVQCFSGIFPLFVSLRKIQTPLLRRLEAVHGSHPSI
ncbi:hypothetical protein BD289DRAFT_444406 [Coniella lustricola]|uniref:Secreted protein n=1 Tax=Coniella lustricola TaxID=2025994 RepID=A0A2T2ZVZ5_9PEZI|nr:hypothetical protein BD289DRAFT_444406 [Coniella lustricola]